MKIKKHLGFTLLETLLALAILSTAIMLLSNAWTGSFSSIRKSKVNYDVAMLLQRKMSELELEYRGLPLTDIPEEREEDFGKEYPRFRWKMTSRELTLPDPSASLTARKEGADETTMMAIKTVFNTINKSTKEVKLTIFYTERKRTKQYSVTTYFVDFDQGLVPP